MWAWGSKDGCQSCLSLWFYHGVDSWPERMDQSERSRGKIWGSKEKREREDKRRGGERRHLIVFKAGCVIPSALKTVVLASVSYKQNRPA